jgi:hypothetical protein
LPFFNASKYVLIVLREYVSVSEPSQICGKSAGYLQIVSIFFDKPLFFIEERCFYCFIGAKVIGGRGVAMDCGRVKMYFCEKNCI